MEDDLIEVNDVLEGTYDIVETNNDSIDADEPLDLGEPDEVDDIGINEEDESIVDDEETPEGWDTPIDDIENSNNNEDELIEEKNENLDADQEETENSGTKGYLDDDNVWHGDEEDEPLFGKDGELRDLNDKEVPLKDDEKESLNGDIKNEETETIKDTENTKGYLDDDNVWHGDEEDEPLFGKDGELRDSNNINANNKIDDYAEHNDFLNGLQSQVESRENVLEKDIERIQSGNWDTNSHKPGGIARTPNDKGKIKDEEDDLII